MKRRWIAGVVVIGLALLVWLFMRNDERPTDNAATAPSIHEDDQIPAPPSAERMNAVLVAAINGGHGDGTITGRVMNAGQPVSGATVTATRSQGDETLSELVCHCDNHCGLRLLECGCPEASEQLRALVTERRGEVVPVGRTASASDGTFTLSGLDPGELALWADEPSLGTTLAQPIAVGRSGVELTFGSGTAIEGSIELNTGGKVSGAWVTAIHPDHSRFFDVLADAQGHFKIGPLPPGKYSLVAGAAGLLTGHARVTRESSEPLVITLAKPQTLDGVALFEGKPVDGVTIHLDGNHRKRDTVTASDGTFRFTALYPGSYELAARKQSLGAIINAEASEKRDAPVKLELHQGSQLSGFIRAADGKPVTNAHVALEARYHSSSVWADPSGHYEVQGASGDNAELSVTAKGYIDFTERLDLPTGALSRDVTMNAESLLSGVVVDPSGAPLDKVQVAAFVADAGASERRDRGFSQRSTAETKDGGVFVLHGLGPGRYRVTASHSEFKSTSVTADAPAQGLQLAVEAGATLYGEVVDSHGAPVAVQVWASRAGKDFDGEFHTGDSDGGGRFTLRGLTLGPNTVSARRQDESAKANADINIGSGENHIKLTLQELLTIEGVVVAGDDETLHADQLGYVMAIGGAEKSTAHDKIKEDGTFVLKGLTAGDYELTVMTDSDRIKQTVKAGTKGVRLVLSSMAITGRVVDSNGQPVVGIFVNGRPFKDPTGRFKLPVRRAGELELDVRAQAYMPVTHQVTAKEHQVVDVGDIVVGAGRDVRVEAVSTQGEPLEHADVWLIADWESGNGPAGYTDKSGQLTLHGVNGSAKLMVNHPTHAPAAADLGEKETYKKVALTAGGSLLVHVTDAQGKPAHAWVLLAEDGSSTHTFNAQTNASGDYLGQGMTAGRWVITVHDAEDRGSASSGDVTLVEGKQERLDLKLTNGSMELELDAALPTGSWTTGHAALLPPGVTVRVGNMWEMVLASGPMETPGHFTIEDVAPGSYTLAIFLSGSGGAVIYQTPVQVSGEHPRIQLPQPDPSALIPYKRNPSEEW
jgi:protocatechuate 3,4-dioxygenase beta subunit